MPYNKNNPTYLPNVDINAQKPHTQPGMPGQGAGPPGNPKYVDQLIAGGFQIGSDVGGGIMNYYSQQRSNKFSAEEAEKARAYNTQMWHLNNAYNTPAEQMKRLRDAGLNPNLMYGLPSSQASLQSSSAQGKAHDKQYDFSGLANVQNQLNQLELTKAQVDNINADTNLKNVEAGRTGEDTKYIEAKRITQETWNKLGLTEYQQKEIEQKISESKASENYIKSKDTQQQEETKLFKETYQDRVKSYQIDNNLKEAQAQKEYAIINLMVAQTLLTNKKTEQVGIQILNTIEDTEIKKNTQNLQDAELIGKELDNQIKGYEETYQQYTLPSRIGDNYITTVGKLVQTAKPKPGKKKTPKKK